MGGVGGPSAYEALRYTACTGWLEGLEVFRNMTSPEASYAMEFAARGGQVAAMDWCLAVAERDADASVHSSTWQRCLNAAASGGHIAAMERCCVPRRTRVAFDFSSVMWRAAQGGHIKAMEWLDAQASYDPCVWNDALTAAAEAGQIAAMDFAYNKGADTLKEAFFYASSSGHVLAMDWAINKVHDRGDWGGTLCLHEWNEALHRAADHGHVLAMEWLAARGANDWDEALLHAAQGGHVAAMNYATTKGATAFDRALETAVTFDREAAVEWLIHKKGPSLNKDASFARHGLNKGWVTHLERERRRAFFYEWFRKKDQGTHLPLQP